MTTPEEVEDYATEYGEKFTSGQITLVAWKEETVRRFRALYRHAKRYGFQPYEEAAEALYAVHEFVLWNIGWREKGAASVKAYVETNPQAKAVYKPTNNKRKETNK